MVESIEQIYRTEARLLVWTRLHSNFYVLRLTQKKVQVQVESVLNEITKERETEEEDDIFCYFFGKKRNIATR